MKSPTRKSPSTRSQPARVPDVAPLLGLLSGSSSDRHAVAVGRHADPHAYLGPHPGILEGQGGTVVRAYHPEATAVDWLPADGAPQGMQPLGDGIFALWLPGIEPTTDGIPLDYQWVLSFADGSQWQRQDPYRFPATLGELDLYYFAEGTHEQLWQCLGARPISLLGVPGFAFSVWAPNAQRVSLVGDFCHWDGRLFPMRRLGLSGVFDLFMPGFVDGDLYKLEILTASGETILKADPLARWAEEAPGTASRAFRSQFQWGDDVWWQGQNSRDITRSPMSIYEVHLGSWLRQPALPAETSTLRNPTAEDAAPKDADPSQPVGRSRPTGPGLGDRPLSYRELAPRLVEHVKSLGFNYLELLPVAEYPFTGSWGYQITGYFAPTSRYGSPDDFRFFVDYCHRHGIGVIIDWVPAHFVKDAHGLGRFDGTALYEHEDARRGEHPDWGTYIFNYGRFEVRSFLLSNALYWLREFHVDGLRVDAVASMLYLDYSRKEGEWIPNEHGGRENLDAISLLRHVNQAIHRTCPGHFTVAEESTAWPGITRSVEDGGLGFTFKWNMGWMHDTLAYFSVDPLFRSGCHDQLTFAMVYENSERFINPLSHDEVVHGKGSLFNKMAGDTWRKLANLRLLYAYQLTRPGKNLLFMGSELAPTREWDENISLDWYLLGDPGRRGVMTFLSELAALYQAKRCLWESDPDSDGFEWVACHDRQASVIAYERRSGRQATPAEPSMPGAEGETVNFADARNRYEHRLVVVLNLTPVPRTAYRLGAMEPGRYRLLMSSDDERFGGSGFATAAEVVTEPVAHDGCQQSMVLTLPPLGALLLEPLLQAPKKTSPKKASPKTKKVPS